jgi:iron complex transport system substrate-binding protein
VRVVSLVPFATELIDHCGAAGRLVGISHRCERPKGATDAVDLTLSPGSSVRYRDDDERRLCAGLSPDLIDIERFLDTATDVVIAQVRDADCEGFIAWSQGYLEKRLGRRVVIVDASIGSLAALYFVIEEIGGRVGRAVEARGLAKRIKAQLMEWADSFFDRTRGRKVVILSSISPLRVPSGWFPDLMRLFSAQFFARDPRRLTVTLGWDEIVAYRPDALIVAPEGCSVAESVKTLKTLQEMNHWEDIPAVKRGDVVFAEGVALYSPGPRFLDGAAVLVSVLAGLESGYITQRDEYFKLRFVELHRHKFL